MPQGRIDRVAAKEDHFAVRLEVTSAAGATTHDWYQFSQIGHAAAGNYDAYYSLALTAAAHNLTAEIVLHSGSTQIRFLEVFFS